MVAVTGAMAVVPHAANVPHVAMVALAVAALQVPVVVATPTLHVAAKTIAVTVTMSDATVPAVLSTASANLRTTARKTSKKIARWKMSARVCLSPFASSHKTS